MRRIRQTLGLLLVASLAWLVRPGHAEAAPTKTTVTNVDSIRHFMEKGQGLFLAGQHLRAAEVFDAGYELHPYSAFLFNAGVALEKAGKLEDAIAHFKRYLEIDPKAPDRADVMTRIARVEKAIEDLSRAATTVDKPKANEENLPEEATKSLVVLETEPAGAPYKIYRRMLGDSEYVVDASNPDWKNVLEGESPANASLDVGHYHVITEPFADNNRGQTTFDVLSGHVLQVKVTLSQGQFMAHLRVTSNVPKASVYLDDEAQAKAPWGKAPFADFVPAGDHVLVVAATGYEPVKRTLRLDRAAQEDLRVDLKRLGYGKLRVSSNVDGATLTLDGKPAGECVEGKPPLEISDLAAGKHFLRVTAKGRKPLESEITIPAGQALPVTAHLVVTPPRGAAYTQAIIGGVLLGGGIYLGLESNRLYDELSRDRKNGSLANGDSRELGGKVYAIGADVAFLSSAVLGGLATYNFLHDPLPPSRLVVGKAVEFDAPNRPKRVAPESDKAETSRVFLSTSPEFVQ